LEKPGAVAGNGSWNSIDY